MPADCLVLESEDLQADESNNTGESEYVKKAPLGNSYGNPFLLADSMIVMGKGTAVVCAVGVMT